MLEPAHIVETEARPAAIIRITVPRAEIQRIMAPAIKELLDGLAAQGIAPAGPLYSYHLNTDAQTFDFELGIPVDAPVSAAGRIRASQTPAAKVLRAVYRGPYEGLYDAWKEFGHMLAATGHTRAQGGQWESYVTGPESSPDPANWRTELNLPLAT